VKAYVLRYWEQEFPQLKPIKHRGNRRYYQREDILLVRQIRKLLYEAGFTIEGARAQLSKANTAPPAPVVAEPIPQAQASKIEKPVAADASNTIVKKIIAELETLLQNLQAEIAAPVFDNRTRN
jgi:DNA-binding transcriptional MerR regulator